VSTPAADWPVPARHSWLARTHVYRVRLDDLEMSTLQALAKRRGVNASVVLRELVRAARPAKAGETATK